MNENQNKYVDINAHDNYPDSKQTIEIPTMKVIPLKKICMTIGQLPTAYIETMSYYEMLIWFIEFLRNNIIPTVNNNGEAVQELQTIVMTLQNYINNYKDSIDSDVEELEEYMNNYFENLDVQEEINNKLDQMLEDGVLTEIIQQFLQSTAIWCFDNVADMKQATNLINGSYARTLGYHTKNDGGSALYKIRTITNDDVVDDMNIIQINNELIAEIIIINICSPEMFGAYGDGVHDDSDALINCFNKTNNEIMLKNKTYLYSKTLNITSNITGNNATLKAIESEIIINITSDNLSIKSINFDGNYLKGILLRIDSLKNISITNCNFYNKGNDADDNSNMFVLIKNSKNIDISNSYFNYCHSLNVASGITIQDNAQLININNCTIEDISPIDDGDGIKVLGNYNAYVNVTNCKFINCRKRALKFQAKYCNSENNTMIFNQKALYPIDFQHGYGNSINDTFIFNYDGYKLDNAGVVYECICICKGNVNIDNPKIILNGTINDYSTLTNSRLISLHEDVTEEDTIVENINITNLTCKDKITNYLLYVGDNNITQINNITLNNIMYNNENTLFLCTMNNIQSKNLNFDITTTSDNGYALLTGESNISNSYFKTNFHFISNNHDFIRNNNTLYCNSTRYISSNLKRENNQTIVKLTDNNNPSNNTYTNYQSLHNCPVGTIALCNTPLLNESTNKYKIGYLCTTAGTDSASGTFVPIEI